MSDKASSNVTNQAAVQCGHLFALGNIGRFRLNGLRHCIAIDLQADRKLPD